MLSWKCTNFVRKSCWFRLAWCSGPGNEAPWWYPCGGTAVNFLEIWDCLPHPDLELFFFAGGWLVCLFVCCWFIVLFWKFKFLVIQTKCVLHYFFNQTKCWDWCIWSHRGCPCLCFHVSIPNLSLNFAQRSKWQVWNLLQKGSISKSLPLLRL